MLNLKELNNYLVPLGRTFNFNKTFKELKELMEELDITVEFGGEILNNYGTDITSNRRLLTAIAQNYGVRVDNVGNTSNIKNLTIKTLFKWDRKCRRLSTETDILAVNNKLVPLTARQDLDKLRKQLMLFLELGNEIPLEYIIKYNECIQWLDDKELINLCE